MNALILLVRSIDLSTKVDANELSICLSIYRGVLLSIYFGQSICLFIYLGRSIRLSMYLGVFLSIDLGGQLVRAVTVVERGCSGRDSRAKPSGLVRHKALVRVELANALSIYLSICLSISVSFCRYISVPVYRCISVSLYRNISVESSCGP